jgi:hypothetical protein
MERVCSLGADLSVDETMVTFLAEERRPSPLRYRAWLACEDAMDWTVSPSVGPSVGSLGRC